MFFKKRSLTPNFYSVCSNCPSGSHMVDVGANKGDITKIMARHAEQVHAFEPGSIAFNRLFNQFKNNPIVNMYKVAVSKDYGFRPLFHHELYGSGRRDYSQGSSLLSEKDNIDQEKYEIVACVKLSDFLTKLNKPIHVLKIDIEGSEVDVLFDLISNNSIRFVKNIFVETHERKIASLGSDISEIKHVMKTKYPEIYVDWNWH